MYKRNTCASCNINENVKFYDKGQTQWGYFKIGWDLCNSCYDREVNFEHDKMEKLEQSRGEI
tara:strand:- start:140 stop:325 length:186 start_codon:yes stop_codon:yes gene_type:complete